MNGEQQRAAQRRRTRAEVRQSVAEFVMRATRRSGFCQNRGLRLHHSGSPSEEAAMEEKKEKRSPGRPIGSGGIGRLEFPAESEPRCGMVVLLFSGRRIEVQRDFDAHTFERLALFWSGCNPCLDWIPTNPSLTLKIVFRNYPIVALLTSTPPCLV
jgi:hypothetical protein